MNRPAVFNDRRQFNTFGAQDDFRSIVQRRLVALAYMLNDQGAVVDESGNIIVDGGDTSGTGLTPQELAASGYSADQIAQLAGSVTGNTSGATGAIVVSGSGSPPGSSTGGWLSGLTSIFGAASGLAVTATNISRASGNPNINPQTGVRYGIDPRTGKPIVSTAGQSGLLVVILFAVLAWFIFKG